MPVIPVEANGPVFSDNVPQDANPAVRVFSPPRRCWLFGTAVVLFTSSVAALGSSALNIWLGNRGLNLIWIVFPACFVTAMFLLLQLGQSIAAQYAYRLGSIPGLPSEHRSQFMSVFLSSVPEVRSGMTQDAEEALEIALSRARRHANEAERRHTLPSNVLFVSLIALSVSLSIRARRPDVEYLEIGMLLAITAFAALESLRLAYGATSRGLSVGTILRHLAYSCFSFMQPDFEWKTPQIERNPSGRARERIFDLILVVGILAFGFSSLRSGSSYVSAAELCTGMLLTVAASVTLSFATILRSLNPFLIETAAIVSTVPVIEVNDVWDDVTGQLFESTDAYELQSIFVGFIVVGELD